MFTLIVFLIIILGIWVIASYNRLVQLKNQVQNAWSQIDIQLQRRYDLVPSLIDCVKEHLAHENTILEEVSQAKEEALVAFKSFSEQGGPLQLSMKDLLSKEKSLGQSVAAIFKLAEDSEPLQADDMLKRLQEEFTATENKISFSKQVYNDLVITYNTKQEEFPALLFSKTFGHQKPDLFEVLSPKVGDAAKRNLP